MGVVQGGQVTDFTVNDGKGEIFFADGSRSGELLTKEAALDYLERAIIEEGKNVIRGDYIRVKEQILTSTLPSAKNTSK